MKEPLRQVPWGRGRRGKGAYRPLHPRQAPRSCQLPVKPQASQVQSGWCLGTSPPPAVGDPLAAGRRAPAIGPWTQLGRLALQGGNLLREAGRGSPPTSAPWRVGPAIAAHHHGQAIAAVAP